MKRPLSHRLLPLGGIALLVLLEVLPWGAVLRFANPDGAPWRQTYAYVDPTPYGYANFGPFLTALLTGVLLLLAVVAVWAGGRRLRIAQGIVSAVALITSLLPLLHGLAYYTLLGGAITLLLAGLTVYYARRKP